VIVSTTVAINQKSSSLSFLIIFKNSALTSIFSKVNYETDSREGGFELGWIGLIVYAILVVASIAAWINTKIILEEIEKIKKHIGIYDQLTDEGTKDENQ
jgi:hypothetical protein